MQWVTPIGLEKCNIEQTENREQTEKPIIEAPLISITIEHREWAN